MTAISNSHIEEALRPYGVRLKSGIADKIRTYISLLFKWNKAVSLTTVTNPSEILKFHFGESVFATGMVDFDKSRLADVGSGAGFPGIPLALAVPSLDVTLIESNSKKCAFLSEAVRELQLSNVTVFRGRMDDYRADPGPLSFVAARALGQHAELLGWAKKNIAADGKVILWLGESGSREIPLNLDWLWDPPKRIPGSERRYLLIGSPKR
jgi:16S rRNA (guanine527-N7)-methyltransferase